MQPWFFPIRLLSGRENQIEDRARPSEMFTLKFFATRGLVSSQFDSQVLVQRFFAILYEGILKLESSITV
jgi:hypothetical protein